jgi:hypothetical protein
MKPVPRYKPDVPFTKLSEDTVHLVVALDARDLTRPFAAGFLLLLDEIDAVARQRRALLLDVARAEAQIVEIDDEIDDLVTPILNTAETSTFHDGSLYEFLADGRSGAEIRGPVLEEELAQVRTWVEPLQKSPDPVLRGYGDALAPKVVIADQRVGAHEGAVAMLKKFDELGERKALVDKTNTMRATLYADVGKLVEQNPMAGLPRDLADRLFRHERRRRRPLTSAQVQKRLQLNEAQRVELTKLLALVTASEKAAAETRKARRDKTSKAALEAAKKKAAELAEEIAALEAEIAKQP